MNPNQTDSLKENLEFQLSTMVKKNNELYFDSIPQSKDVPKIEKKIMANPTVPPVKTKIFKLG